MASATENRATPTTPLGKSEDALADRSAITGDPTAGGAAPQATGYIEIERTASTFDQTDPEWNAAIKTARENGTGAFKKLSGDYAQWFRYKATSTDNVEYMQTGGFVRDQAEEPPPDSTAWHTIKGRLATITVHKEDGGTLKFSAIENVTGVPRIVPIKDGDYKYGELTLHGNYPAIRIKGGILIHRAGEGVLPGHPSDVVGCFIPGDFVEPNAASKKMMNTGAVMDRIIEGIGLKDAACCTAVRVVVKGG